MLFDIQICVEVGSHLVDDVPGLLRDSFLFPGHILQQYKAHERSRESIELAFDAILQKKYKLRNKYGFRPPSTGRKTDIAGDEEVFTHFSYFVSSSSAPISTAPPAVRPTLPAKRRCRLAFDFVSPLF